MAGENLFLTYATDAVNHVRAKCVAFAYGYKVIATESHAREHRAMYPHQRALGQFKVSCLFKTYAEYQSFMQFFRDYARSWLHPPTTMPYYSPGITVLLVSGDYQEQYMGVPVAGITDGDHVGNIAYPQTILFQEIYDPLEKDVYTGNDDADDAGRISQAVMGDNYKGDGADDTTRFFYPFSPGSENIGVKATDIYGISSGVRAAPLAGPGDLPNDPTHHTGLPGS